MNKAFHTKYRFAYPLLSDGERTIAKAYGALDPDQPDHALRHTFVIGADGRLELVQRGVNAKTHPRALLDSV